MLRYFPPQIIENMGDMFSSLSGWQYILIICLFLSGVIFFILSSVFYNSTKNLKSISLVCFILFLCSFFSTYWLIASFFFGNSLGWLDGLLVFIAQAFLFIALLFCFPIILYFCLGVTKLKQLYDWKLWACLIGGLAVVGIAVGILSILFGKLFTLSLDIPM